MAQTPDNRPNDRPGKRPTPRPSAAPDRSALRMLHGGAELAGAALLLGAVGWWVDRRYGTEPWGVLIGGGVGMTGGMYLFIKQALDANRQSYQDLKKKHPEDLLALPDDPTDERKDDDWDDDTDQ